MLTLPSLDAAIANLEGHEDPIVAARLRRVRGEPFEELRERIWRVPDVVASFASQHADGSWGNHTRAGNRLLPTLWMVKTLAEMGLDRHHAGWERAAGFLATHGHAEGGVFSVSGAREGVLSCYVGIAALTYLEGGLPELALPQVDWIVRHQEVKVGGSDRRIEPALEWAPHLRTKYGGCMAETTCLVGLLRAGRALALAGRPADAELVAQIREAFLERRLIYASNGSVMPLAVSPGKADSWLRPTFPLDWRIDLIELLAFVSGTGAADPRMQEAIDEIAEWQLPDGTWPLRRAYRPEQLSGFERPSKTRSSPMVTLRVVEALQPLLVS